MTLIVLVDLGLVTFLGLLGQVHVFGVLLVVNDQLREVHVVEARLIEEVGVVLVQPEDGVIVLHLVVCLLFWKSLGDHVDENSLRSCWTTSGSIKMGSDLGVWQSWSLSP